MRRHWLIALAMGSLVRPSWAGPELAEAPDYLTADPEAMQWWSEARFGMFVCWGPVSLTGLEIGWSRGGRPEGAGWTGSAGKGPTRVEVYDELYKEWRPDRFDAREWVQVALDAGAKYMIFLVKHHDGFCLYDSALTDHKSTSPEAAWQRDVMKEIADACHDMGLKLFIYYSQPDWHHPDYCTDRHDRYIEYLHGQIRELLTNYGHIDGLWFDGLAPTPPSEEYAGAAFWGAEALFEMARTLQPHLMINNRCGFPGDFDTPEQRIGRYSLDRAWESCITLGTQWAWKPDDTIKSLEECIHTLVSCAGGGGNLALNTNPMPDGRIEPRQAERYGEIGAWLARYGEAIYGTQGGPYQPSDWGCSTRKGNRIYLHVFQWDGDRIELTPLGKRVVASSALTGGQPEVEQTAEQLTIRLAPEHQDAIDTVVVLELDGPANEIATISKWWPTGREPLSLGKPATASGVWGEGLEAAMVFDGDESTRWGAGQGEMSGWLAVDLGEEATFDAVLVLESPWDRVRKFRLERLDGEEWVAFHEGTTLGDGLITFEPVTSRHVRLNILEATNVPTIWEFQVFGTRENAKVE